MSEKQSILYGLAKTGRVITLAGFIMAIAFLGLLFSGLIGWWFNLAVKLIFMTTGEPVLNQLSFFLVFSVLLDTLLIRTVVVPCCMVLIGLMVDWDVVLFDDHSSTTSQVGSTGIRSQCRLWTRHRHVMDWSLRHNIAFIPIVVSLMSMCLFRNCAPNDPTIIKKKKTSAIFFHFSSIGITKIKSDELCACWMHWQY